MKNYCHTSLTITLCTLLVLGLTACTPTFNKKNSYTIYGSTDSLSGLRSMHATSKGHKQAISRIRLGALKETGMAVGAQSGLAWRTKQINKVLSHNERELDDVFNFSAMMLKHHVLPPILEEAKNTLHLAKADAIRLSDRTYKIQRQARFVSTAPTWREYLWMTYPIPEQPDASILPQNKREREAWNQFVESGWNQGVRQADIIYNANLARLRRDYMGMALYKRLLTQNIVSKPFVARSELGVTGDSSNIRINDQVLRITTLPALSPDSKQWKAILTNDHT